MKPIIHISLWLDGEDGSGVALGSGRVELLKLVDELGSLSKAADKLEMSYRSAWGKIKRAEASLKIDLIEAVGSRREGSRLTPKGKELVKAYETLLKKTLEYAEQEAEKQFNNI